MLASDWQNPLHQLDVSDDVSVSPIDALLVINDINKLGSRLLPIRGASDTNYFDCTGDGYISPIDVLVVINALNANTTSLPIDIRLQLDSGLSNSDSITNDPRIEGSVATNALPIVSARVRVNRDNVLSLPIDSSGRLHYDPRATPSLVDGDTRIAVAVTLADGTTGLRHLEFTYDATAPTFVPPRLSATDDSGLSDSDNVTRHSSPHLKVEAEIGSHLVVRFDGQTLVDQVSVGSWETQLNSLSDGDYEVRSWATDVAGNVSQTEFPVIVTIDTVSPPATPIDLAITSDTGVLGDHETGAARVTLVGTTERRAVVSLDGVVQPAKASNNGKFLFPNIALANGANSLTSRVVDLAGNIGPSTQTTITRVVETAVADPVLLWNNVALEAIRLDATDPPMATRTLAMLGQAVFDVANAVDGNPGLVVNLPVPNGMSAEAAVSSAAFEILKYAYPAQLASLSQVLSGALSEIMDGPGKSAGIAFGQSIAWAIILLREHDGWDAFVNYVPREIVGQWRTTSPMYAPALLPQWENLETFAIASAEALIPNGPPDLASAAYSRDLAEVAVLGRADSTSRTSDQMQIARFWADGPGTTTPPGHWNSIASQVTKSVGSSWGENARLFAELNLALGDAAIVAWKAKYQHEFWRPITAIQQADFDQNPQTQAEANWSPLLISPPFPEYVSGHSTFSGAASKILTDRFGSSFSFTTDSPGLPNVQRSFSSFDQAADEAGRSRIYGGIHFEFSNRDGQIAGRAVAEELLSRLSTTEDVLPPKIVFNAPRPDFATNNNPRIAGWVIDNLSGVRGLQAAIDGGAYSTVNVESDGQFSLQLQFALNGSQDGLHVVHFRAIDHAGVISPVSDFRFTLDTLTPTVSIDGQTVGATINAGTVLSGTANGTGSSITSLAYRIDAGPATPIAFERSTGRFSQKLDLSKIAVGAHTLTVVATDAAGLVGEQSLNVQLANAIPFVIATTNPLAGASDVGTTIRPQVFFSRPVNVSSLNSTNFYATGPDGEKLPARIVPATDGLFAWLFFQGPMPSGALVTLHVDGATIPAAADGVLLDANGDGVAGGKFTTTYRTVSLMPLLGTSLSGKIVDPGPDLSPMSFDDIRAGADGMLHTPDDEFLTPIAGVKVFILGLESQFAITDAAGNFRFDSVPAGNIKLAIDGRTATNPPSGFYFPEMVMDLTLRAGVANTVMGTMGTLEQQLANADRTEVYLPRLRTSILQTISETETTTLSVAPENSPGLTDEQRSRLTLSVPPGRAIGHDGQPMVGGQIGVSTVPPELVREMLPPGLLQHTFDITIQAPGIDRFTEPVPMTFPNLMGASPGSQLNFLSFDHATGRLVIEGTATVSADGLTASTDPGTGITHPGWHGFTPPVAGAGSGGCPPSQHSVDVTPIAVTQGLDNYFFKDDRGSFTLAIGNRASPIFPALEVCSSPNNQATPLVVEIVLQGNPDLFLNGLTAQKFQLLPGQDKQIRVDVVNFLDQLRDMEQDRMFGLGVEVKAYKFGSPNTKLVDEKFYVYRFVDVADAVTKERAEDGIVVFPDTLVDGLGGIQRFRIVEQFGPIEVRPEISILSPHFDINEFGNLVFDPQSVGNLLSASANVLTPDGEVAGTLQLRGDGTPKIKLDVNKAELKARLEQNVKDATTTGSDVSPILFTPSERALLDTDVERDAFVDDLATLMIASFANVSQGIELGFGANSIIINWAMDPDSELDSFGDSGTPEPADGVDIGHADGDTDDARQDIMDLFLTLSDHSQVVQNFMVSQLMNQSFQTNVAIFPDNVFESQLSGLLNLSRTQMLNVLKKVTVHEAGHTLGLRHTAQSQLHAGFYDLEVQRITLVGGNIGDTFTLTFNGATTAPLRFDSNAIEVSNALDALPTIGPGNTHVQSVGLGGPYTVTFQLDLRGFNVPLITGIGTGSLGITTDTILSGGIQLMPITVADGTNDIMFGGRIDTEGALSFRPGLSQDGLRVGLHLDWTSAEAQNIITFWAKHLAANGGQFFDAHAADGAEPGSSLFPGPQVFIVDDAGNLAFQRLDMGTASSDGPMDTPVLRSLSVSNIGSEDVVINEVGVHSESGAYSVNAVPSGTIIAPGEELTLSISFDPTQSGDHLGFLSLSSNDANAPSQIRLNGFGKSSIGDLRVDVENNNFGGRIFGAGAALRDDMLVLRNFGSTALKVHGVQFSVIDDFSVLRLPVGFGPSQPITIAPGATYSVDISFDPSDLGLRRGVLEILTNDPDTPVYRQVFVGTGLANSGSALDYGNDYVAIETHLIEGAPTMRQRSDDGGNWNFFLPTNEAIHSVVFDPVSGLISHAYDITPMSGQPSELLAPDFLASTSHDTDGDGLPDDVEFAVGTGLGDTDTDNDGISDYVEIIQGLDPLGGLGLPTGIVSAVALNGQAYEVTVEGSLTDSNVQTAFVATGLFGLAIVDVTRPTTPVLLSEIDLNGLNTDVAVDLVRNVAVLAAGFEGIQFIDISNPAQPFLTNTIPVQGSATRLELFGGTAFVVVDNSVVAIDLDSKNVLQTLTVQHAITDLALDGSTLLILDNDSTLHAITLVGSRMILGDSIQVIRSRNQFAAGDGIAYLPVVRYAGGDPNSPAVFDGFVTIDVSNPFELLLLGDVSTPVTVASLQTDANDFAITGSGIGLKFDRAPSTLDYLLNVFVVADPLKTNEFVTRIQLPDLSRGLAIANGFAFVADSLSDLQIVNFQPIDTKGLAPVVNVSSSEADSDPVTPGIQVRPGAKISVDARVNDDVLVRNVELLVNGQVVRNDASFPWDLVATVPFTNQPITLLIQARATDTGGNTGISNLLSIDVIPDLVAPALIGSTPSAGQIVPRLEVIDLLFDEALDPASINASGVTLTNLGPNNVLGGGDDTIVAISPLSLLDLDRTLRISPNSELQTPGQYRLVINPSILADIAGNHVLVPVELNFSIPAGNPLVALRGFPADPSLPSANAGQEFSFVMPWVPELARTKIVLQSRDTRIVNNSIIENAGDRYSAPTQPRRSDLPTQTAFFRVDNAAITDEAAVFGGGHFYVTDLPNWTVTNGELELFGQDANGNNFQNELPGNGLYVELGGNGSSTTSALASKALFQLTPGEYELRFDLAGARFSISTESVVVSLGTAFNETFSRPALSPFSPITRMITVTAPVSAQLLFDQVSTASKGIHLDNVKLTRVDSGAVLLDDHFDLPFSDGNFLLQIVPTLDSVDILSISNNGTTQFAVVALRGSGFIEGENTTYRFGTTTIVDTSFTSGPDVSEPAYSTLTLPLSDSAFGAISVSTAGGRSDLFSVSVTSISAQALSGTPANPTVLSANPGQSITLHGDGLSMGTDIEVQYRDQNGQNRSELINPTSADLDGTSAQVILPNVVNGIMRLRVFGSSAIYTIQIVPVVHQGFLVPRPSPQPSFMRIFGRGFYDGDSTYDFDGMLIYDGEVTNFNANIEGNTIADVFTAVPENTMLTVTTPGGTSSPVLLHVPVPAEIPAPSIVAIVSTALDGVPANPAINSANTGQVITVQGTNFRLDSLQVVFPTINESGIEGVEAIAALAVNDAGTLAQVRVPDLAATGNIHVTSIGSRNYGLNDANDAIHRSIEVTFTPTATTTHLRFADGGLSGLTQEGWGIDNVQVSRNATNVFSDDFQSGDRPEWSRSTTTTTQGLSRFSGPYSSAVQKLTLTGLTVGVQHQLRFDLYVLDTWDGLEAGFAPDRFIMRADDETIFDEALSNDPAKTQTYVRGPGIALQIVPTITGTVHTEGHGYDNGLRIFGTGFMEGASTIKIGGVELLDQIKPDTADLGVDRLTGDGLDPVVFYASQNKRYSANTKAFTLDGPIRVATAGGYFEIAGPQRQIAKTALVNSVEAVAKDGVPLDPNLLSANTGQYIKLFGAFYEETSKEVLFEFQAIDDTGKLGTVTRSGSRTSTDIYGREWQVLVPEMARTGMVRILGTPIEFFLQVVPTLRDVGPIVPGTVTVLEGTGLLLGDLSLSVDGQPVENYTVQTVRDGEDRISSPNSHLTDRQMVTFTAPAGITLGEVKAVTTGGTAMLRSGVAAVAGPPLVPTADVGDTLGNALPVSLSLNQRFAIASDLESRPTPNMDEDYYRFNFEAGDRIVFDLASASSTASTKRVNMQLQGASGNVLLNTATSSNPEVRLEYTVPTSGIYFLRVFDRSVGLPAENYQLYLRRLASDSTVLTGISATAERGTPLHNTIASVNVGQVITLFGNGLRMNDRIVFNKGQLDHGGAFKSVVVAPLSVSLDGTSMTVQVPLDGKGDSSGNADSKVNTGSVQLVSDGVGLFLQVVPTVDQVRATSLRFVTLFGSGFDYPAVWRVGEKSFLTDFDAGHNLAGLPFGPISVSTVGGTTAPLATPDLVSIAAIAASGVPANPSLPSTNPGQTIVVNGSRLRVAQGNSVYSSSLLVQTIDAAGVRGEISVAPTTASPDGTSMTIVIPNNAVTGPVSILGDLQGTSFILQIVPIVTSIVPSATTVRVNGKGLIEGATLYRFGDLEVLDGSLSIAGANVDSNTNDRATISASVGASGIVTVTTAGGTSAPISYGAFMASSTSSANQRLMTSSQLTREGLQPIIDEAIARMAWAGSIDFARKDSPTLIWGIMDLPGNYLGFSSCNTIYLDDDAAGWGWFVDSTPADDSEFHDEGIQAEQDRMDLLTVVMHELGHYFGLDHEGDELMSPTLSAGTRRTRS